MLISSSAGGHRLALGVLLPSLLCVSTLLVPASLRAVTITEIHYHPSLAEEAAAGNANLEWIEVYNDEATTMNLSGYRFINGIDFVFPPDTYLAGRSYIVVCADEAAVQAKYGITNTIGNFLGRLDNDGETIELAIYGGGTEVRVSYGDRNQWPQGADGAGHTIALIDPYDPADDNDNWKLSTQPGGTPGAANFPPPEIIETVLFPETVQWRYRKNTSAYPADWFLPEYDDSAWLLGSGILGYGDGDDTTVLSDMEDNYISIGLRRTFTLTAEQAELFDEIVFQAYYDDGFVLFLNGEEVARNRVGAVGDPVLFDARANSHEARSFEDFVLRVDLEAGEHTLAVSAHNATISSSDFSFGARLVGRREAETSRPIPITINECFVRSDDGGWVELFNLSTEPLDIGGLHLSDDTADLDKFRIPDGTVVAGRDFITFDAATTGLVFTGEVVRVLVTRSDGQTVLTAEQFDTPLIDAALLAGTSEARIPDGTGRFFASNLPTAGSANDGDFVTDLVIHEIFYHPPDTTPSNSYEGQSFLELHNRSDSSLDLSGFRFTRGISFDFPDGTSIAAGGYLVVAEDPPTIEAVYGIAGVLGPWTGTLSRGGELLRVVDALGNIADEVRYHDGGRWSDLADGGGSSLELMDPWQDNSVASAWSASDESTKSEWQEVTLPVNGFASSNETEFQIRMLVASECLIDSITMTRNGTNYVRNGDFDSNTNFWRIEGNHIQSARTTEDSFEGAGCLRIVATGDGDTRVNRIEQDTSPRLPSGNFSVEFAVRWLAGGNLLYLSGWQQPASFQLTHWISMPQDLGTPGAPNSTAVGNLGPVISEVLHSPPVPSSGEPVRVEARVSDADGVDRVFAHYDAPGIDPGQAELFDDGAHDDGIAGDGRWAGLIPGQSTGTRMTFWIEATDAAGESNAFPRTAPDRTLVYEHSTPLTARSFTFRLVQDDASWAELTSRRLHSNELLDATFIFNEEKVYYNVGTRFRGSPWQRPGNPRMHRVGFNKDDRYRGRKAININRYGSAMNERAGGYAVWRNSTTETPSPYSRASWGRFRTNGGLSIAEAVDPINSDYLDLWFPGDSNGVLMKVLGKQTFDDNGNFQSNFLRWASYANRGTNKANYRWNFSHRTREFEDDFEPLIRLMQAINSSSSTLKDRVEEVMDVEQFLRVYAARTIQDDWDTIAVGNGQNAFLYYASVEGRWKLLPWDMDHTYGNTSARLYPDADSSFARVIAIPEFRRKYQSILNEMINGRGDQPGYWTVGEMVAKWLEPSSAELSGDGVAGPGGIRNFINGRSASVRRQIPDQVEFEITSNAGEDFTSTETPILLDGLGWVDIDTLLVNGEPVDVDWTTTTRWEAEVDLLAGENLLTLVAFDVEGNIVGSDTITVFSTIGWQTPEITSIDPAEAVPGERVQLEGIEFHPGISVLFGGIPSASVDFDEQADPGSLSAEVPLQPDGPIEVVVRNVDERTSAPIDFTVLPLPPSFARGDMNLDLAVNVSDAVRIVRHLFAGVVSTCEDAGDVNDDEALDVTDVIALLGWLYQDGPPPMPPFPGTGPDPSGAGLDCEEGYDFFAE